MDEQTIMPYPNTPGWSQWLRDRITYSQEHFYGVVETIVETPQVVAKEAAGVAPAVAGAAGEGLGSGLSKGAIVAVVGLTVVGGVVVVGGGAAALYFLGPEIAAGLATAKAASRRK